MPVTQTYPGVYIEEIKSSQLALELVRSGDLRPMSDSGSGGTQGRNIAFKQDKRLKESEA